MRIIIFVFFILLFPLSAHAAEPKVVVTIKPLHSLVAAVMEGSGASPTLLVDGKSSPHTFALKPSQVQALQKADIIFYMADGFELFLKKALQAAPAKTIRAPMETISAVTFLSARLHDDDGHGHSHASPRDLHAWLRPDNARAMVMEIARQLSIADPDRRALYFENARLLGVRLDAMGKQLDGRMAHLRGKPFIVFHDAIQYFEKYYDLSGAGAVVLLPDQGAGAKHLSELRAKLVSGEVKCIFHEPFFDSKSIKSLTAGTAAQVGVLDAEGALLAPGPNLYFDLMEGIASSLERCLAAPQQG